MGSIVLQMLCAWLYGHLVEYVLHRFYLHNTSKFFINAFKHHFKNHHGTCRKHMNYDKKYSTLNIQLLRDYEYLSLSVLVLLHFPLYFIVPYFFLGVVLSAISYALLHTLCHRYTAWGRKWMPWHYDHHLAPNQHMNWGVRLPIFDILFGTRKKHINSWAEFNQRLKYLASQEIK